MRINNNLHKARLYLWKPIYISCLMFKFLIYTGRRGRDRMVVGFITTTAISAYHH